MMRKQRLAMIRDSKVTYDLRIRNVDVDRAGENYHGDAVRRGKWGASELHWQQPNNGEK